MQGCVLETRPDLQTKTEGIENAPGTQTAKRERRNKPEDSQGENCGNQASPRKRAKINGILSTSTFVNRAPLKHPAPTSTSDNFNERTTLEESHHKECSQLYDFINAVQTENLDSNIGAPNLSEQNTHMDNRDEQTLADEGYLGNRETDHRTALDTGKTDRHKTLTGMRKKLKCLFTNAQSIVNKRDELQTYMEDEEPDLVGIVETWLHSDIADAEIQVPGYQTTRLDRQNRAHGGILLCTKDGIDVQKRENQELSEYDEALWCDISSPGSELDLLLGIVYRSPNNSNDENDRLNKVLKKLNDEQKEIMIIGDFNYRDIDWETMQTSSSRSEAFMEVVMDNLLIQHVTQPTRQESLLDLVITSNPDMIDEVEIIEHLGRSDHNMLKWDMNFYVKVDESLPKRDFRNANIDQIKSELNDTDWRELLSNKSTEEAWDITKRNIKKKIHQHVPMKQAKKKKKALWLTKRALRFVRRKRRAWKRYKANKDCTKLKEHYRKCQKEASHEVEIAKK